MLQTPTRTNATLIAEAERLIPWLREQSAAIEAKRRLTLEVHAALIDAGFYRITMPETFSNVGEGTLSEVMRILETLARGDASTAWSVWAALGTPAMSAFIGEEGTREMFSGRDACVVGSIAAMGRAVAVDGGYRVSGHWPFLSGICQATYAGGTCFVFDGDSQRTGPDGQPLVIIPTFPIDDCVVIDIWNTTGLRGTGSNDITVEDLFVPTNRVADFSNPPRPGLSLLHYLHIDNAANVTVSAMALGIASVALEAFRELGVSKRRISGELLAETPGAKIALAHAEVRFAQARGYLYETADLVWEDAVTGNLPGDSWLPRTSLASTAAVDAAVEIVSSLYRAAGTSAIFASRVFDRCLRDIYTLAAHKTVQRDNYLLYGGATFAAEPIASATAQLR
jgi:alkylation response protein AidB-like acyl-CoA dehydrogenase